MTKNQSVSVKTLHTILKLNVVCLTKKHNNNIVFVNDTPSEKHDTILKNMKKCDRLLFIEYSVSMDEASLHAVVDDWNSQCVVFPCVKPGIDWELFKKKVFSGSDEPLEQCGLHFDTEVEKCMHGDYFWVSKTDPRVWVVKTKFLIKNKGSLAALKTAAFTPAKIVVTYPHECVGNIIGSAGVKRN